MRISGKYLFLKTILLKVLFERIKLALFPPGGSDPVTAVTVLSMAVDT